MTIREAYQYIQKNLGEIYDEAEASVISEWVLEHLTGIRKTDRLLQKDKSLSVAETTELGEMMKRLQQHEPVQYVINEAWFCGLKFYVDRHVLIPRPETEELIEWVISDCRFPIDTLSIFDIGTGSGCIALALKKRLGRALVEACDMGEEALAVARRNALNLGIDVGFRKLDFLDAAQREQISRFDIIISNPPYIAEKESADMPSNVLLHEPRLALFVPDNDPLLFYREIATFGLSHLNPGGKVYVEINEQYGDDVKSLFTANDYTVEMKKDLQGKDRMLRAWIN